VFARAGDLPIIGCAHDSFILEDRADQIKQTVWKMQQVIRAASSDLLGGFKLRADCDEEDITYYPDRFIDKREREDGMQHWNWLMRLIEEAENDEGRGRYGDHGRGGGSSDEEHDTRTIPEANDESTQAEIGV